MNSAAGPGARQKASKIIRAIDIFLPHKLCRIALGLGVPARPAWGAVSGVSPQNPAPLLPSPSVVARLPIPLRLVWQGRGLRPF